MKNLILIIIAILLVVSCIGAAWFKNHLKKGLGAYTEVVNPAPYFENYKSIGIKNVNILDPENNKFIPHKNIVLENGKICTIKNIELIDSSINYIDGTGKYLIPGLVDSHVHLRWSKNDLMLYLANGVTTVWEMFGIQKHLDWRDEKLGGKISPSIFVASKKLSSKKGLYNWGKKYFYGGISYTKPEAARRGIRKLKRQGFDAIKLSSFMNKSIYDAILDESGKLGIPVMGHLPYDVGLDHMYESGLSELAHVEEITKYMMYEYGGMTYDNTESFISYLKENADSVAIKLKENNITVSTTLFLMESFPLQKFEIENYLKSIELKYVNPPFIEGNKVSKGWLPGNNHYENVEIKNDPKQAPKSKIWWDTYAEAIQIMTEVLLKNNVVLLAGTDANATGAVPGFSLHKELASLANNAGLSNAEVLQSATSAPAQWTSTKSGSIIEGYNADVVLLSDNPLENINNTQSIETVFVGNHFLTKDKRKELLKAIEQANEKSRSINIEEWN